MQMSEHQPPQAQPADDAATAPEHGGQGAVMATDSEADLNGDVQQQVLATACERMHAADVEVQPEMSDMVDAPTESCHTEALVNVVTSTDVDTDVQLLTEPREGADTATQAALVTDQQTQAGLLMDMDLDNQMNVEFDMQLPAEVDANPLPQSDTDAEQVEVCAVPEGAVPDIAADSFPPANTIEQSGSVDVQDTAGAEPLPHAATPSAGQYANSSKSVRSTEHYVRRSSRNAHGQTIEEEIAAAIFSSPPTCTAEQPGSSVIQPHAVEGMLSEPQEMDTAEAEPMPYAATPTAPRSKRTPGSAWSTQPPTRCSARRAKGSAAAVPYNASHADESPAPRLVETNDGASNAGCVSSTCSCPVHCLATICVCNL